MSGFARRAFASPYLLLALAPLLWGGNAVAGKIATLDWQPFTITAVRWGLATLLLLPFAWRPMRRDMAVIRAHLPLLVGLGALGMALFNLLMYLALHTTSAVNVGIIQAAMPGMIMVANFVVFRQRSAALQLFGLAVSIVGVVLVVTAGSPAALLSGGLVVGDAWMLLACVFYGGYTFALRWKPALHWMSFMWVISISAFAMTLPFVAWEWSRAAPTAVPLRGWLVVAYVVIFPTIVSQIAWARGVELIGSNRAGLFINLVPIFGAGLAVLLLGERIAWYHALGLLLVLGGITLAERSARAA